MRTVDIGAQQNTATKETSNNMIKFSKQQTR